MRTPTGDRATGRERELTAYLAVGDLGAARRLTARSVGGVDQPAPRDIAFWWWLRGLPARDRVALVMATRHGWAYDDGVAALLDQASAVLGRPAREAPAAVTAALDRLLGALTPGPGAQGPAVPGRRRPRRAVGAVAAALLLAAAASAIAGVSPTSSLPAEPPPVQLLPRPLARPIANYEDLAVLPGRQGDLPERGERRSAPPWTR